MNVRKILFVIAAVLAGLILLAIIVIPFAADEQKFKVSFTITFNEMTLSQAAEKEKQIRDLFEKKADEIVVNVNDIGEIGWIKLGRHTRIYNRGVGIDSVIYDMARKTTIP